MHMGSIEQMPRITWWLLSHLRNLRGKQHRPLPRMRKGSCRRPPSKASPAITIGSDIPLARVGHRLGRSVHPRRPRASPPLLSVSYSFPSASASATSTAPYQRGPYAVLAPIPPSHVRHRLPYRCPYLLRPYRMSAPRHTLYIPVVPHAPLGTPPSLRFPPCPLPLSRLFVVLHRAQFPAHVLPFP